MIITRIASKTWRLAHLKVGHGKVDHKHAWKKPTPQSEAPAPQSRIPEDATIKMRLKKRKTA